MPEPRPRPLIVTLLAVLLAAIAVAPVSAARPPAGGDVLAREVRTTVERVRVVALPIRATHVALHWPGEHDAEVTIAGSADGRAFGPPNAIGHDELGEQRGDGRTYGSVTAVAGARFVRITTDRPLRRLTVIAFDAGRVAPAEAVVSTAVATAAAADGAPQPPVISRAAWGANESLRTWAPEFYPVQKLVVHHTATTNNDPNPAATVRAIYHYHAVTQGWGDIGYNFLVDEAGRIYEGRYSRTYAPGESPTGEDTQTRGVTAAHVQGYNSGTVGVAFLGTLTNVDATPAARTALEQLLAWKAERHAIDPLATTLYTNPVSGAQRTFANISGHRDLAATECPGGTFYSSLPALRTAVAARIAGQPSTVPGAPTLSVKNLRPAGQTLLWTTPPDGGSPLTAYRIYRSTAAGSGSPSLVGEVAPGVTSFVDGSRVNGVAYWYTVRAVNAIGAGPASNEVRVKGR